MPPSLSIKQSSQSRKVSREPYFSMQSTQSSKLLLLLILATAGAAAAAADDVATISERVRAERAKAEAVSLSLLRENNVCDVREDATSMFCMCDSLSVDDATEAECFLFNETRRTDAIWSSFASQPHLRQLKFRLRPEGRLDFVPVAALRVLDSLVELEVTDTDIDAVEANSFARLQALRNLTLNSNKVITGQ